MVLVARFVAVDDEFDDGLDVDVVDHRQRVGAR
jgi:hypothetical protein